MRSVQVGKHPEEVAPEESASARDEDGLACEAMDEIAEGKKVWHSNKPKKESASGSKKKIRSFRR